MANRDPAANQLINFKNTLSVSPGSITTSGGCPIGIKDAIQTVGPSGAALLQDVHFMDEISHFACERIPERVVCAKGTGAFGYFEVTHDISPYCAATLFEKIKKRTPIAVRFSTLMGECGSPDSVRDPRGFAVKFYTDDGVWDLVGSNMPVFFIRDPALFPSLVHSQKRNPQTHLRDPDMYWDFISLRPETLHLVSMVYGERGLPDGYRHMHGYGVHTYRLINVKGEPVFAKFHLKTDQGIQNLAGAQAEELAATDPDYATRDLHNAIKNGSCPSWTLFIQTMSMDQAKKFKINPFDVTKVWPHKSHPLTPVGKIVLDRNPTNYFVEVEQLAFSPAHLIPGIEPSYDKLLQGRLFCYMESQRHRLGVNYMQIPVNCPYRVSPRNYQRDGPMTVNNNKGAAPNYYPNSFVGPQEDPAARSLQLACGTTGEIYRYSSGDTEDNFVQATNFWVYVLNEDARNCLVACIAKHLSQASQFIQERALTHFTAVHADFGRMLNEALNIARMNATPKF